VAGFSRCSGWGISRTVLLRPRVLALALVSLKYALVLAVFGSPRRSGSPSCPLNPEGKSCSGRSLPAGRAHGRDRDFLWKSFYGQFGMLNQVVNLGSAPERRLPPWRSRLWARTGSPRPNSRSLHPPPGDLGGHGARLPHLPAPQTVPDELYERRTSTGRPLPAGLARGAPSTRGWSRSTSSASWSARSGGGAWLSP